MINSYTESQTLTTFLKSQLTYMLGCRVCLYGLHGALTFGFLPQQMELSALGWNCTCFASFWPHLGLFIYEGKKLPIETGSGASGHVSLNTLYIIINTTRRLTFNLKNGLKSPSGSFLQDLFRFGVKPITQPGLKKCNNLVPNIVGPAVTWIYSIKTVHWPPEVGNIE